MIKRFLLPFVFLALALPCFPQSSTSTVTDPVVYFGDGEVIQNGFDMRSGDKLKIVTTDNASPNPHWHILSYRIKIIKQGDIIVDEICLGDSLSSKNVNLIRELPTYSTVVFHNIIVTSDAGPRWIKGFAVVIHNEWEDEDFPVDPNEDDPPHLFTEEEPEFPGGMEKLKEYLRSETHYPAEAKAQGIEGEVFIDFVVERDGSITNAKVKRRLFPQCDDEALRVILSMPKWTPGKNMGKPVRARYMLPVPFELP